MAAPRQLPDRMLRDSLRTPANLRDFLESALPDDIANFDFTRMEEITPEVFTGHWHEREADLIFTIDYHLAGQKVPAVVGLLIEHQSDTDVFVPLRAFFILAGFWERIWRQWEQLPSPKPALRLPPIFSIVLYTGERVWGSNDNIRDLLGQPATLHRFSPNWGPVFWNLAERTADALLAGPAWMQLMAVLRATSEEQAEYQRVFTEAIRHLAPTSANDHARWSQLLRMILGYTKFRRPAEELPRYLELAEQANPDLNVEEGDVQNDGRSR